ncbi:hypothetical protein ACDI35_06195 [Xanthomonas axonopodis pv. cajani]|uniref:hypothetical protein n=1 Tax=Xanthomonas TaxID=338 RepID=UPI0012370C5B|nr:hypothetical protein [Xanthomonas phaseoli]
MNKENPATLDLHDAIIESISLDFSTRTLKIYTNHYQSRKSSKRSKLIISFYKVANYSCLSDLESILDNSKSGNINSWSPAKGKGTTYIYLVEGCIQVAADNVEIDCEITNQ